MSFDYRLFVSGEDVIPCNECGCVRSKLRTDCGMGDCTTHRVFVICWRCQKVWQSVDGTLMPVEKVDA